MVFVSVTDTQDFQNQSRTTYEDAPYFLISSCALFLFGLVAASPAQAQANSWELGPLLGVNFEEAYLGSKNNEFLIGGVSRVHLSSLPISLNPGLEFYPGVDNGSLFVLNFDAQYQLEAETVKPYDRSGHLVGQVCSGWRQFVVEYRSELKGRARVQPSE